MDLKEEINHEISFITRKDSSHQIQVPFTFDAKNVANLPPKAPENPSEIINTSTIQKPNEEVSKKESQPEKANVVTFANIPKTNSIKSLPKIPFSKVGHANRKCCLTERNPKPIIPYKKKENKHEHSKVNISHCHPNEIKNKSSTFKTTKSNKSQSHQNLYTVNEINEVYNKEYNSYINKVCNNLEEEIKKEIEIHTTNMIDDMNCLYKEKFQQILDINEKYENDLHKLEKMTVKNDATNVTNIIYNAILEDKEQELSAIEEDFELKKIEILSKKK